MILSVIGFLIILGPLVIIHEFGHFSFAKLFGVKAEIFSVGFGPRLWSKKIGETEWRVSAIPMGGYVKLLGEDQNSPLSAEEQKRALHRQKAWKRFFIFLGGPLFNFIFAALVFMVILVVGEQQMASYVGRVVENSAAAKAGFLSGDKVNVVNGKPVRLFDEIINEIRDNPGKPVEFEVMHPGQASPSKIEAMPTSQDDYSIYGEATHVGEIDGLLPAARATTVGISDPESLAAKAGFKSGDEITEINAQPVKSWEDLESAYAHIAPGAGVTLRYKRLKNTEPPKAGDPPRNPEKFQDKNYTDETFTAQVKKPEQNHSTLESAWGLRSSELFIEKVVDKSPAEVAGVKAGDRLVSVGGQEMQSFFELRDAVQKAGEKGHVDLKWERDGKILTSQIEPTTTSGRDPLLKVTKQYTIGVIPMLNMVDPPRVTERVLNPFKLVIGGVERMAVMSWRNLVSIQKMIVGDVSVKSLGGPIMIGKIAGESLTHGLVTFLTTMAMLSIGLGVLNVLPVPVLDGGHLLLLGIESIRGRPLTMKQMEIIQGVGLSLILLLMAVVMRNDFLRVF